MANKVKAPKNVQPQKLAGRAQVFVTTGIDAALVYLLPDRVLALVDELGGDLKYRVGTQQMSANELIAEVTSLRDEVASLRNSLQDEINTTGPALRE